MHNWHIYGPLVRVCVGVRFALRLVELQDYWTGLRGDYWTGLLHRIGGKGAVKVSMACPRAAVQDYMSYWTGLYGGFHEGFCKGFHGLPQGCSALHWVHPPVCPALALGPLGRSGPSSGARLSTIHYTHIWPSDRALYPYMVTWHVWSLGRSGPSSRARLDACQMHVRCMPDACQIDHMSAEHAWWMAQRWVIR